MWKVIKAPSRKEHLNDMLQEIRQARYQDEQEKNKLNELVSHQQAKDKKLKDEVETRIQAVKELILALSLSESLAEKPDQRNSEQVCLTGRLRDIEQKLHDLAKTLNMEAELVIKEYQ